MPVKSRSANKGFSFLLVLILHVHRKTGLCLKNYRTQSFLSYRHVYVDLCKHLGIYSSTK